MMEYKFWDEVLAGVSFVLLFVFLAFL